MCARVEKEINAVFIYPCVTHQLKCVRVYVCLCVKHKCFVCGLEGVRKTLTFLLLFVLWTAGGKRGQGEGSGDGI